MTPDMRPISGHRANTGTSGASPTAMASAVGSIAQARVEAADAAPKAWAAGDDHAWVARLIEQEGSGILRMLWRMLGSEADVMDAYQDCFCMLAARKKHNDLKSAKSYAYRTASNIAIELIRTRSRHRAHWPNVVAERSRAAEANRPCNLQDGTDQYGELRGAIAELPAHLRNVVLLRDLGRISYDEVGAILGIDPATARVYRRHAVVKLAEILEPGSES